MSMKPKVLALAMASSLVVFAQQAGPANPPDPPDQQQAAAPYGPGAASPDMQQAPPQAAPQPGAQAAPQPMQPQPMPPSSGWRKFGSAPGQAPMMAPLPSTLTMPAGTWISIRVDQPLSSDHNQAGDFFSATLLQPLVVNGVVVARRGQTVGGVVAEAIKAGRAKGVSHLRLELTELSLVDGRQVPVKTQLVDRRGDTSVGRDVAAIGTTTGAGAAIGAAAAGGFGAGMGAIAGAGASTIGVLLTRGRPTVVFPETPLTFQTLAPVAISTVAAPDAFQPVNQSDYGQRMQYRTAGPGTPAPYYGYYSPYWYSPYWYPYWGWGPSLYFGFGHGYWGRGYYHR
jgi:type IV secretion system protein VirB10